MAGNETAKRISEWSEQLGGDGRVALYYSPTGNLGRSWEAITTIAAKRQRGRYLSAFGRDPDDALYRLFRTMPAVPTR